MTDLTAPHVPIATWVMFDLVESLVLDSPESAARLEQTLRDPASERWGFEASRIRLAFAERVRRRKELSRARVHPVEARAGFAATGADPLSRN